MDVLIQKDERSRSQAEQKQFNKTFHISNVYKGHKSNKLKTNIPNIVFGQPSLSSEPMKDMICNKYGIEYESLKDKEVII